MSARRFRLLTLIIASALLAPLVGVVYAASFDGTYDLTYQVAGREFNLKGGLIISGGVTSSPRAGFFKGRVDSSGNVWMQSPDPEAPSVTATYTGLIRSDGTGSGSYTSQYGHGTWQVKRVSGGGGGGGSLDWDAPQYALGVGVIGGGAAMLLYTLNRFPVPSTKRAFGYFRKDPPLQPPKWYGRVRTMGFTTAPPSTPPTTTNQLTGDRLPFIGEPGSGIAVPEGLPPFIGYGGGGVAATGPGARVGGDLFPRLETLFARRTGNGMDLWWEPPKFNPETEALVGYRVYAARYGPWSTAPIETPLFPPLGPAASNMNVIFNQTYRVSTGGDIAGFRVEPIFFRFTGPNPGIFPGQGSTFAPW